MSNEYKQVTGRRHGANRQPFFLLTQDPLLFLGIIHAVSGSEARYAGFRIMQCYFMRRIY